MISNDNDDEAKTTYPRWKRKTYELKEQHMVLLRKKML